MLLKRNVELGLFIVRVLTGVIFLLHGFSKFQGGIGGTMGFFQSIGLPGALAPIVAIIEILGGLLLILGLLTRMAGVALTVIMVGVLLTAKAGQPFMMGTEFDYLLLFTSLQLAFTGSLLLSVDSLLFKNKYNSRLAEN